MWRLTLTILFIAIGAGVLALVFALLLALNIRKQDEGDETIRFIGNAIRDGANAFLSPRVPDAGKYLSWWSS